MIDCCFHCKHYEPQLGQKSGNCAILVIINFVKEDQICELFEKVTLRVNSGREYTINCKSNT